MRAVTMMDLRFDSCSGDQTDASFKNCYETADASFSASAADRSDAHFASTLVDLDGSVQHPAAKKFFAGPEESTHQRGELFYLLRRTNRSMPRKDLSGRMVALQAEVECAKECLDVWRVRGFNRLNPSEFSFSAMRIERFSDLESFIVGRETRTCNEYSTLLLPDAET